MTEILQTIATGGDLATYVLAYAVYRLYGAVQEVRQDVLVLQIKKGEGS